MKKRQVLFLFISLISFCFATTNSFSQQTHKKYSAKKKGVAKDSSQRPVTQIDSLAKQGIQKTDSLIVKDTNKALKKPVQKPKKKKGTQKKVALKEKKVEKIAKSDSIPEEKDTVKVTFGKNIVNLKTFDGWIVNEKGKWIHSHNRIPFTNPDFNNELYTKYKLGSENIRQINVCEVKIDSERYLAIIIEQYKGHYLDRKDSDFRYFVGADYYLIKPDDYQYLWNDTMKMKQPYQVNFKAWYSGLVGYKDIKLRPKYMAMEINKDIKNRIYTDTSVKTYLQFGLKPFQNKAGRQMRFYYSLAYAKTGAPVAPFDFSVFKDRFYEADLDLFHKFSRPSGIPVNKKIKPKTVPPTKKQNKPKAPPKKPVEEKHEERPPIED